MGSDVQVGQLSVPEASRCFPGASRVLRGASRNLPGSVSEASRGHPGGFLGDVHAKRIYFY